VVFIVGVLAIVWQVACDVLFRVRSSGPSTQGSDARADVSTCPYSATGKAEKAR
jgi:hypothetical protein